MSEETRSDEELIRIQRIEDIKNKGIDPFGQKFVASHNTVQAAELLRELEAQGEATLAEQKSISLSGRLMAKRGMGKAVFANIQDISGNLQVYFKQADLLEQFEIFEKLYVGDIIGIEGKMFRTQKQEPTLRVEKLTVLCCAIKPLPEKYHGMTDKELRYRRRPVDLIMNQEVRETFIRRSKMISSIRKTLDSQNFFEVETPVLHAIAGGAAARPFVTHHNALDMPFYLRIATELHLKRLLVGGMERVYEIGRIFRNEGVSYKHNPEFTTIEIYQAYADYQDMMTLTETIFENAALACLGTTQVPYKEQILEFKGPWKRIRYMDAIAEKTGLSLCELKDSSKVVAKIKDMKLNIDPSLPIGKLYDELFGELVEGECIQPTIVYDYPIENSPLAKQIPDSPDLTYRFEAIVFGMEVANAFTELNDPIDQKQRFEQQMLDRESGDDEAHQMDHDFVESLEYGMPPAGGLGIGIDRLAMLLSNNESIREVILFPHMRNK